MRQRGAEGWVATVLILSKTADAAAADAAANQTHLWWYPLGYNTDPHPTFHPDSSLTPSPSSTATTPTPSLVSRVLSLAGYLSLSPSLSPSFSHRAPFPLCLLLALSRFLSPSLFLVPSLSLLRTYAILLPFVFAASAR